MVRVIFKDGGTEFSLIKAYCDQHGIRTDLSAPYTPEQNGIAESANKVVLIKARSMLIDARMPAIYWLWAVEYACLILTYYTICERRKLP